jgi:hypothetical protein
VSLDEVHGASEDVRRCGMRMRSGLKVITFLALMMVVAPSVAQAQDTLWAKQWDRLGAYLTVDRSHNVYRVGTFYGTVDLDPGPGTFELTATGEFRDVFVSKLDRDGGFLWAGRLGGTTLTETYGAALDDDGNVYIVGALYGTADFDPGPGTFELTSPAWGSDSFVCKLDSSGNFVWAKATSEGVNRDSIGLSVTVDGDHVYAIGAFDGTVDFNPGPGTFELTSDGLDAFVWKLDSDGNLVWARQLGGGVGIVWPEEVVVAPGGYVYAVGAFGGTADFDPGPGVFNLVCQGEVGPYQDDAFVLKLDDSGNFVWAGQFGGVEQVDPARVLVDHNGDVYTVGRFSGTADFDPGPGVFNLTSAGDRDVFYVKLDGAGNFVWAKRIGGELYDATGSLAVDGRDNVYTGGTFRGTMDFDPGPAVHNMTPEGEADGYILKLDSAGNFVWANQLGGPSSDGAGLAAVDSSDNLYITGGFSGTVDVDPGPGTFFLTSIDEGDAFVSKFGYVDIRLEGQDPTLIHFSPDSPSLSFDVATGLLSDLKGDRDFSQATCLDTFYENPATDDSVPPVGDAFYYLARGLGCCTTQGYGDSTLILDPRDDLNVVSPCP